MSDLGKVSISQSGLGPVTVFQPNRTTITSPNYKPKPNVSLSEINDVSTEGVQNNYLLVFNSANNRYELSPAITIASSLPIDGGTF